MPDRFADGDATNDEPMETPGSHDRSRPRAYHGGDLRGIQNHLPYLKDLGVTTLWLTPVVKNGAAQDNHGYGADRKSTRLNSSHSQISYAVFCLKKKKYQ